MLTGHSGSRLSGTAAQRHQAEGAAAASYQPAPAASTREQYPAPTKKVESRCMSPSQSLLYSASRSLTVSIILSFRIFSPAGPRPLSCRRFSSLLLLPLAEEELRLEAAATRPWEPPPPAAAEVLAVKLCVRGVVA